MNLIRVAERAVVSALGVSFLTVSVNFASYVYLGGAGYEYEFQLTKWWTTDGDCTRCVDCPTGALGRAMGV